MNTTPGNANGNRRHGLTLLEVMLVLAVIAVIAGIVLPRLAGPLARHRLRKSADLIRADWLKARITAMRTGRIQVFRFQIEGNRYRVEPYFAVDDYLESNLPQTNGQQGMPAGGMSGITAAQTQTAQVEQAWKLLPEGVVFVTGQEAIDSRALFNPTTDTQTSSPVANMPGGLSQPILFYPDGSCSTVKLVLRNKRDNFVVVQLRGMTGTAQASDLMTRQELTQ